MHLSIATVHLAGRHAAGRQRGLSLVELMVGIAVGMFIVAAATMLVSTQLTDNRRLLTETQIQQDLRAATDIVTRDLRRAGAVQLVDSHAALATPLAGGARNVYAPIDPTGAGVGTQVQYSYSRTAPETGPFGFRVNNGALQTQLGGSGWQDLTDRTTLQITALTIERLPEPDVVLPCQRECVPGGGTACWPRLQVRRYRITITGQSVADERLVRTLRTEVRPRTDEMSNPLAPGVLSCP